MPSARVKNGQLDRTASGDESRLTMYVAVNQVTGSYAILREIHHQGCENEEETVLAKIRSDAVDGSREALMEFVSRLLEMHALRVIRAHQLQVEPY